MNIRPSLFIGLGSSGCEIIKEFRRLMYEQFNRAGLPIFKYLGIETIQDYSTVDDLLPGKFFQGYENISLKLTTISGQAEVHSALASGRYGDLGTWFDRSMMRGTNWSVSIGAGHVRMFGRLALWLKWDWVIEELTSARTMLLNPGELKDETMGILSDPGRREEPKIRPGYDVYLVGTLCGGTCGGMFIDLAYELRDLLSSGTGYREPGTQAPASYLNGIFTIHDRDLALTRDDKKGRQAANCWASLLELDYFMDPRTLYDYRLPSLTNQSVHRKTTEPPFDLVQIVSRTNTAGKSLVESQPELLTRYEGTQLNTMVALKIFNHIFSGLDAKISPDTVNGFMSGLVLEPQGGKQRKRIMISFGLSAIYNPKLVFAQAYACDQAMKFCKDWSKDLDLEKTEVIAQMATKDWKRIRGESLDLLMTRETLDRDGRPRRERVEEIIKSAIDWIEEDLRDKSLENLPKLLEESIPRIGFGDRAPLREWLQEYGYLYDQIMSSKLPRFEETLGRKIESQLTQAEESMHPLGGEAKSLAPELGQPPVGRWLNLSELKAYVMELQNEVRRTVEKCPKPENPPKWEPTNRRLPGDLEKLSKSWWMKRLGIAGAGIDQARKKEVSRFEEGINVFMKKNRRYLIREVLERVMERKFGNIIATIQRALKNLDPENADENSVVPTLRLSSEKLIKLSIREVECIHKISRFKKIEDYVAGMRKEFQSDNERPKKVETIRELASSALRTDEKLSTWLECLSSTYGDPATLDEAMRLPLSEWALTHSKSGIDDLAKVATTGETKIDSVTLANLAEQSGPFVYLGTNFIRDLSSMWYDFVCGCGNNLRTLARRISEAGTELSYENHGSGLDNIIVLYRQTQPLFIDDLVAASAMADRYEQIKGHLSSPGSDEGDDDWLKLPELHTHISGAEVFNKKLLTRVQEIEDKLGAVGELYGDEVFRVNAQQFGTTSSERVLFKWTGSRGVLERLRVESDLDRQALCKELAGNEKAMNQFNNDVKTLFEEKGKDKFVSRWEALKDDWGEPDSPTYIESNRKIGKLFDELYPSDEGE